MEDRRPQRQDYEDEYEEPYYEEEPPEEEQVMSEDEQAEYFQEIHDNTEDTNEKVKNMAYLVEKQHKVITIFAIAIVIFGILTGYSLLIMDSNNTYQANTIDNMVKIVNVTLENNGVTGITREQIINGEDSS